MFSSLAHLRLKLIGFAYGVEHHQPGPQRGPWPLHGARYRAQQSLHGTAAVQAKPRARSYGDAISEKGSCIGSACLVFPWNQKQNRTDGYIYSSSRVRKKRLLKPHDPPTDGRSTAPSCPRAPRTLPRSCALLRRELCVPDRVRIALFTV